MPLLNDPFPLKLFLLCLFLCQAQAAPPDSTRNEKAGSGYCGSCHGPIYKQWQNRSNRQACESCHGPGRAHALAPTKRNIDCQRKTGFSHGPDKTPILRVRQKIILDLFIMSHCPYGTAALETLIPLAEKWKGFLELHIYHIAHLRGEESAPSDNLPLPSGNSDRCETDGNVEDGNDRYISLHGLPEVEEGIRQAVLSARFSDRYHRYLLERGRTLDREWSVSALKAGFSKEEIGRIRLLCNTATGDSLFKADIAEAQKRRVGGSPTLFINGNEFNGAIAPYPIERHFCQERGADTLCRGFPACGFDKDCEQPGQSGTCLDAMTEKARCVFKPATRFNVIVVNDEHNPLCHTGNLIRETRRRFPGAQFHFVDLASDSGRNLINRMSLTSYPAFLFDADAQHDEKFRAIQHTFRKAGGGFVLKESVVGSYHLLGRTSLPGRVDFFGSPQLPPVVEMIRDIEEFLHDSTHSVTFSIHPVLWVKDTVIGLKGDPLAKYDSPIGPDEIRESIRELCVDARYPAEKAYDFRLCRGFDVQGRFEEHLPEPAEEWRACAHKLGLDTVTLRICTEGREGRALLDKNLALLKELRITSPEPGLLLNNLFWIGRYGPPVRKILQQTLKGQ